MFSQAFQWRRLAIAAFPLFVLGAFLAGSTTAKADENYLDLPIDPATPTMGKLSTSLQNQQVGDMLNGTQQLDPAVVTKFFNEMAFPIFVQWKSKAVGTRVFSPLVDGGGPAKVREALKRNYIHKATNAKAHDLINEIMLTKMSAFAAGNYHPVVRANAIMMLGDLNESEPNGPPWKKAQPALLQAVIAKDVPDTVRIAALRGLVRQAEAGIDGDARNETINAMVAILQQRKPAETRDQVTTDWMCRRAIDVLAALGDMGANTAAPKTMLETIDDPAASLAIRSAAAAALAKVKFTPPANFNATNLAKSLGKLAIDNYKTELAAADVHQQPIVVDRLKRNELEVRLGLVGDGKGGVLAMSTAPTHQPFVTGLVAQIDALIKACGTPAAAAAKADLSLGVTNAVPIDTQKPIATAISAAGSNLEAVLKRGDAPAGGGAVPGTAAAVSVPAGASGGDKSPF